MKNIIFAISLAVVLVSCGGKKQEQATVEAQAVKVESPVLGLWVQQEPATEGKREIMFNEDRTGFVFVADTLHSRIKWEQGSSLNVTFEHKNGAVEEAVYTYTVNADTLCLGACDAKGDVGAVSSYVRFKE